MYPSMFVERILLVSVILTAASAAPTGTSRSEYPKVPMWHNPCGNEIEDATIASVEDEMEGETKLDLKTLINQLDITMNNYVHWNYGCLYEKVKIGVEERQYVPNWLPDEKNVNIVKSIANGTAETIVHHFPALDEDLQKFAVAFEQLLMDEVKPEIHEALRSTQENLRTMLCHVETVIVDFSSLKIPPRIERRIMSDTGRNPVDDTRRLVRDWGIVMKYGKFLCAWRKVFLTLNAMENNIRFSSTDHLSSLCENDILKCRI